MIISNVRVEVRALETQIIAPRMTPRRNQESNPRNQIRIIEVGIIYVTFLNGVVMSSFSTSIALCKVCVCVPSGHKKRPSGPTPA